MHEMQRPPFNVSKSFSLFHFSQDNLCNTIDSKLYYIYSDLFFCCFFWGRGAIHSKTYYQFWSHQSLLYHLVYKHNILDITKWKRKGEKLGRQTSLLNSNNNTLVQMHFPKWDQCYLITDKHSEIFSLNKVYLGEENSLKKKTNLFSFIKFLAHSPFIPQLQLTQNNLLNPNFRARHSNSTPNLIYSSLGIHFYYLLFTLLIL